MTLPGLEKYFPRHHPEMVLHLCDESCDDFRGSSSIAASYQDLLLHGGHLSGEIGGTADSGCGWVPGGSSHSSGLMMASLLLTLLLLLLFRLLFPGDTFLCNLKDRAKCGCNYLGFLCPWEWVGLIDGSGIVRWKTIQERMQFSKVE